MTNETIETKIETIEVTGFAFHKIVNERLVTEKIMTIKDDKKVQKSIPPQMIYNYMKKNFIKTNSKNLIILKEANVWLDNYIAKLKLNNK